MSTEHHQKPELGPVVELPLEEEHGLQFTTILPLPLFHPLPGWFYRIPASSVTIE